MKSVFLIKLYLSVLTYISPGTYSKYSTVIVHQKQKFQIAERAVFYAWKRSMNKNQNICLTVYNLNRNFFPLFSKKYIHIVTLNIQNNAFVFSSYLVFLLGK